MSTWRTARGTLPHALTRWAKSRPSKPALVWEGGMLAWEDLLAQASTLARTVWETGVQPGEFIASWGTVVPLHVVALCASALTGTVHIPLNPRWPQGVLRDLTSKLALIIWDGRLSLPPVLRSLRTLAWAPRAGAPSPPLWRSSPRDPVTVDFTRGRQRGTPRGAVLTHEMVLGNASSTCQVLGLEAKDSIAFLFPAWNHPHELIGKGLATGCTSLGVDFPYPRTVLNLLVTYAPTWVVASPRVLEGILPFGDRCTEAFAKVKGVLLVGDFAKPRLVERLLSWNLKVLNGWGSAETAGVALAGPLTPHKVSSCGTPCPGYEASLRSPRGEREGELLVRGPAVSLTYLDKRPVVGPEGWFATEDVAQIEEDGTVRLVGRPTEVVAARGKRVPVARIEAFLARLPGVADVVIVPPSGGSPPTVFVEPEGPLPVLPLVRRLSNVFGEHLPEVKVVQALPRTPDGRVDRAALASQEPGRLSLEALDKAILDLLNRRAALVRSQGFEDQPLASDEMVIQRVVGSNTGPLFDDSVREVFRAILHHCRLR